jgi:hypothetical protein
MCEVYRLQAEEDTQPVLDRGQRPSLDRAPALDQPLDGDLRVPCALSLMRTVP